MGTTNPRGPAHALAGKGLAPAAGLTNDLALSELVADAKAAPVMADLVALIDSENDDATVCATLTALLKILGETAAGDKLTSAISEVDGVLKVDIGQVTSSAVPTTASKILIEISGVNKSMTIANFIKAIGEAMINSATATSAVSEVDGVIKIDIGTATATTTPTPTDKLLIEVAGVNRSTTITNLVKAIGEVMAGVVGTSGVSEVDGILTIAPKLLHLVADEKSALFVETGEFDFSGSADVVDTIKVDAMAAKGRLLFALISTSQVFDGTLTNVISISSTASGANKMAGDLTLTIINAYQNLVGNAMIMWGVSGADGIADIGGDVYFKAGASAGRTAGKIKYALVFRKSA